MRRELKRFSLLDYWFYAIVILLLVVVLAIFLGPPSWYFDY